MTSHLGLTQQEIEFLGHSLRRIKSSGRMTDTMLDCDPLSSLKVSQQKKKRIWYQGDGTYFNLSIILNQEEIEWFQFTLRGKALIFQRNYHHPQRYDWQVGKTNEGEIDSLKSPATSLIHACQDRQFPNLVYAILQIREGEKEFDQMLKLFENCERFDHQ